MVTEYQKPKTVEFYIVRISPADLLKKLRRTAQVTLSNAEFLFHDDRHYDFLPLTQGHLIVRVETGYKEGLLEVQIQYHCPALGRFDHLHDQTFSETLSDCSVRRWRGDMANPDHPEALYNTYDLSIVVPVHDVVLLAPVQQDLSPEEAILRPMLGPQGLSFGSVKLNIVTEHGECVRVSIFPKIVRKLSNLFAPFRVTEPKTYKSMHRVKEKLDQLFHRFTTLDGSETSGGVREEGVAGVGEESFLSFPFN
ncbi:unnamed protein product [Tilletia caries]|nr:unnamed protein product [Tilletia caries]CAD6929928.1 unnamed protein product [Tilletia caries]